MSTMTRTGYALAAVVVAFSAACGGGGGGGGGGGPTQPPTPGIRFSQSGSAGSNSIALTQGAQTNVNRLFLEVRVNAVSELYGVAFDLTYPTQALAFARATEGSFLRGDTSLQVEERTAGTIVVGLTNLGENPSESGSGLLLTLEFTPVASGSGSIAFDNEQAYGPGGVPKTVTWVGGTVTMQL